MLFATALRVGLRMLRLRLRTMFRCARLGHLLRVFLRRMRGLLRVLFLSAGLSLMLLVRRLGLMLLLFLRLCFGLMLLWRARGLRLLISVGGLCLLLCRRCTALLLRGWLRWRVIWLRRAGGHGMRRLVA